MFDRSEVIVFQFTPIDFESRVNELLSVLSQSELKRMEDYINSDDRLNYLIAHSFVRLLLSDFCRVESSTIRFTFNQFGKPTAIDQFGCKLDVQFNITHSKGVCLLAFGLDSAIGIDVEFVDVVVDVKSLAESFFHEDERAEILRNKEGHVFSAFYKIWTLKEAYLKARGVGLNADVSSINVFNRNSLDIKTIESLVIELSDYKAAVATDLSSVRLISAGESLGYVEGVLTKLFAT